MLQGRVLGYFGMTGMEDAHYQSIMMERLFAAHRDKVATKEKVVADKEAFALPASSITATSTKVF